MKHRILNERVDPNTEFSHFTNSESWNQTNLQMLDAPVPVFLVLGHIDFFRGTAAKG